MRPTLAGLEKNPGFLLRNPAQWLLFFFFLGIFRFFGFLWLFNIFAQKREFLGFFHFQEYFKVHPDFKL
jgi:hypothetical protein